MKILLLLALTGNLIAPVLAQARHRTPVGHKKTAKPKLKVYATRFGTASFYANKFEGRKTATGDIFRQEKLSGACNVIPLNSWVRITNMRNRRRVILKVNDRMHPRNPRLIDLSHSAAKELRYTGYGIQRVKLEVLGKKLPPGLRTGLQPAAVQ